MVERVKGGVKLFVGRLPMEATQQMLQKTFAEYGDVLEVFLIDSARGTSGARCAFVRLESLEAAERSIAEMHEQRVLIPERKELGPIQVAFAKGEAVRFGLDQVREQLPARWQIPAAAVTVQKDTGGPSAPVDPDSLSKEALVSLIKEGQRTGGQPFKQQWWGYCDSGKGGVHDYDPKRHSRASLRQFFVSAQQGEWGAKPWFRRAIHWALLGGRTTSRPRGTRGMRRRRRRRKRRHSGSRRPGSSSSRSSSSYSSSSSSSSSRRNRSLMRKRRAAGAAAAECALAIPPAASGGSAAALGLQPPGVAGAVVPPLSGLGGSDSVLPLPTSGVLPLPAIQQLPGCDGLNGGYPLSDMLRGAPPVPLEPQPPPPSMEPLPDGLKPQPQRILAPASDERDPELEAFLTRNRISPSTSFLMLKLTREQASAIMDGVNEQFAQLDGSEQGSDRNAEQAVVLRLKQMGVRTKSAGGGSWTSTERTERAASPLPASKGGVVALDNGKAAAAGSLAAAPLPTLPSMDVLLGPGLTSLPKVVEGEEVAHEEVEEGGDGPRSEIDDAVEIVEVRTFREVGPGGGGSLPADTTAMQAQQVRASRARRRRPPPPDEEAAPPRHSSPEPPPPPPLSGPPPSATGGAAAIVGGGVGVGAGSGAKVFVKNLNKNTGEREIRELFSRYGSISEVDIPWDRETGQGRGFAYLTFPLAEDAEKSIRALNFTKPWGRALVVERFRGPGNEDPTPEAGDSHADEPPQEAVEGGKVNGAKGEASTAFKRKVKKPLDKRKRGSSTSARGSDNDGAGSSASSSVGSGSGGSKKSGWSRYTVGSRNRKERGKKKSRRRSRGRRRRRGRSSYSEQSSCTGDDSRSPSAGYEDRMDVMPPMPPMGWPGGPGPPGFLPGMPPGIGPPGMCPPGFPPGMLPPPWAAMPPWMQPPSAFDENGFPVYDREDAERQLRRAERRAKREERRREREQENEVWEDHPGRKQRRSASLSPPVKDRSPSRVPQRVRSRSPSCSKSRSSRSERKRSRTRRSRSRSASSVGGQADARRQRHLGVTQVGPRRSQQLRPPLQQMAPPIHLGPPGGFGPGHPPPPGAPLGGPCGGAGLRPASMPAFGPLGGMLPQMPPLQRPPPLRPPPMQPPVQPSAMLPLRPIQPPLGAEASPRPASGSAPKKKQREESDESDVDIGKVQEEINFADI